MSKGITKWIMSRKTKTEKRFVADDWLAFQRDTCEFVLGLRPQNVPGNIKADGLAKSRIIFRMVLLANLTAWYRDGVVFRDEVSKRIKEKQCSAGKGVEENRCKPG